jgi:hypothetical protein
MKTIRRLFPFFLYLGVILSGCADDQSAPSLARIECSPLIDTCGNCNYQFCTHYMSDGSVEIFWYINGAKTFCGSGTAVPLNCGPSSLEQAAKKACCAADSGESCDDLPCKQGMDCVGNAHCRGQDPDASNVCRVPGCPEDYPLECGTYCCPTEFPICLGNCLCAKIIGSPGTGILKEPGAR